jgi:hypothetical protein
MVKRTVRRSQSKTLKNRHNERAPIHQLRLASRNAVRRGFDFLCSAICEETAFQESGYDYLFSLMTLVNSRDLMIRKRSREVGQHLSRKWVAKHPTVPSDADADTITELVFGSLSSHALGVDNSLKPAIQAAASQFHAEHYYWFDPTIEPPPNDVPEDCECGDNNDRGETRCSSCGETLDMRSRYEVWLLALIRSYLGERYGVTLGARYSDVLKWLPQLRPYPTFFGASESDFGWSIYAITHIVYTLNDYNLYRLDRRWLPDEFEALVNSLETFIGMEDPETVGEILDCLKTFKVNISNPLMERGVRYLLSCQNPDGSWGELDIDDVYVCHHTTITALNGLGEYLWRGTKLPLPRVAQFLATLKPVG